MELEILISLNEPINTQLILICLNLHQACAECPASYEADPASGLLCGLWLQLENKEMEDGDLNGMDNNDLVSTSANLAPVTCVYGDHGTSAADLCDLWCQIQLLEVRSLSHN